MAHAQKPDFVFRRNGRVHLKRRGRQFSRLLAAEVCASAVVMLDTPCSEVVWRVLATHFIRQFPLHFPSRASPCAITFQLDSTTDSTGSTRLENRMMHHRLCKCIVKSDTSFTNWRTTLYLWRLNYSYIYEGNSINKLQIVIEKNRMEIMTYKQHLFFNIISIQI